MYIYIQYTTLVFLTKLIVHINIILEYIIYDMSCISVKKNELKNHNHPQKKTHTKQPRLPERAAAAALYSHLEPKIHMTL